MVLTETDKLEVIRKSATPSETHRTPFLPWTTFPRVYCDGQDHPRRRVGRDDNRIVTLPTTMCHVAAFLERQTLATRRVPEPPSTLLLLKYADIQVTRRCQSHKKSYQDPPRKSKTNRARNIYLGTLNTST